MSRDFWVRMVEHAMINPNMAVKMEQELQKQLGRRNRKTGQVHHVNIY